MLVKHLMTPLPFSVQPKKSVADAAALMTEKGIRHLIVCDGDELVGLITRSSLATALPGMGTGLTRFEYSYLTSNTLVCDVMIKEPVQATERMAAEEAARIMNANRISSLVVMKEGKPVGIITDTDIFKAMLELLGAKRPGIRVTVRLDNRPGVLANVSSKIAGSGGNISAVGVWDEDGNTSGALIKVENLSTDQIKGVMEALEGVTLTDMR